MNDKQTIRRKALVLQERWLMEMSPPQHSAKHASWHIVHTIPSKKAQTSRGLETSAKTDNHAENQWLNEWKQSRKQKRRETTLQMRDNNQNGRETLDM